MIQEQTAVINSDIPYFPYLHFSKGTALRIDGYIKEKVKDFFQSKGIDNYCPLNAERYVPDLNFKEVEFKYFYDYVLNDIKKESNRIHHTIKYCVTLDQKDTDKICEKTEIKYSEILLNKKPIFYFIYLDFQEIMDFC